MTNAGYPTSMSKRKELFGGVHRGQYWVKVDDGKVMRVVHRNGSRWTCEFAERGRGNRSHTLTERDIYKFYRPLRR